MRLFFCSTDSGRLEFLFTTDAQRATELFAIYMVLAGVRPAKMWFSELTTASVIPQHRADLKEALSHGVEAFASYDEGKGWGLRPVQDTFDNLSENASGAGVR